MRKHFLVYALLAGLLVAGLGLFEYRGLTRERAGEIYGALIAGLFVALGIWFGRRLIRPAATVAVPAPTVAAAPVFIRDNFQLDSSGITPRELQVLEHIAAGLSNKEIAARLHISESAVKAHSSRVFDKLGARRRAQALQRARTLRLIP